MSAESKSKRSQAQAQQASSMAPRVPFMTQKAPIIAQLKLHIPFLAEHLLVACDELIEARRLLDAVVRADQWAYLKACFEYQYEAMRKQEEANEDVVPPGKRISIAGYIAQMDAENKTKAESN
jgi:hypothetical protein